MARVRANVAVKGHNCWTLFDTGARNTYVVKDLISLLPMFELERPEPVSLGGNVHRVTKVCWLTCLIGALAMEEWGIRPIPDQERLDMSHYPREFVEYLDLWSATTPVVAGRNQEISHSKK